MSGYLLRKANISQYVDCSLLLVYDIPPDNELYTFLQYKAHVERGTLVYLIETFIAFIQRVEDWFSIVLSAFKHMEGMARRLFKNVSKSLGKLRGRRMFGEVGGYDLALPESSIASCLKKIKSST